MKTLEEIQLTTTLEERRKRGDLNTIYKLMNNLEQTETKFNIKKKKKG